MFYSFLAYGHAVAPTLLAYSFSQHRDHINQEHSHGYLYFSKLRLRLTGTLRPLFPFYFSHFWEWRGLGIVLIFEYTIVNKILFCFNESYRGEVEESMDHIHKL